MHGFVCTCWCDYMNCSLIGIIGGQNGENDQTGHMEYQALVVAQEGTLKTCGPVDASVGSHACMMRFVNLCLSHLQRL